MDPAMKRIAPQTSVLRLPMRSATVPPTSAPIITPTSTAMTRTSCIMVERWNESRTKIKAAAMTPMSKP